MADAENEAVDWQGYGPCPVCPVMAGWPCVGGRPHEGRPFVFAPETPVLDAVRADLAEIDTSKVPGGRTYEATALWLARVIDKRGSEDGPSVTAKLADQLTKVMQLLTRKGGDDGEDDFKTWSASVSTPQR